MRKTRVIAVVEALALAFGVALLVYVSCRGEEPEAARESRVFSAARTGPGASPSAEPSAERRALEAVIGNWLREIATARLTEERRADLQNQLVHELTLADVGKADHRAGAAGLIVQQMFDQSKSQVLSPYLSERQVRAIDGMSRELTRQLVALSSGTSPGADSIVTSLPPGVERVEWNSLGGFSYHEGMVLPPEVVALDNRRVGMPGFMLTLGDTEVMREFIFVESLWGCCFGSVPDINQTILVRLAPDETVNYTSGPILVTGTLKVGEERSGTFVTSLYRLDSAHVQPLDTGARP